MTTGRDLRAFLDESLSDHIRDPHCYMLAATLCAPSELDQSRATMEALRLRGQLKLHWRDESAKRRRQVATTVAALPLHTIVVIRNGRMNEGAERRRRHCLERMLHELDKRQVDNAVFESRGPADDRRDRHMLDALRARKIISSDLRMEHTPGPKDPLLWVADAVCGAVTHDRTGQPEYLHVIRRRVDIIAINAI